MSMSCIVPKAAGQVRDSLGTKHEGGGPNLGYNSPQDRSMKYYTIPPSAKLAPYVRMFWVYEGEASAAQPYIYRGFADGCTEMVFHYRGVYDELVGDDRLRSIHAGIHAQTRRFTRFVVDRDWSIFGCYLYPFALPKLFGLPASDFTDRLT